MPNLYSRKLYDVLMSKPNVSRYVKRQLSVTASELHDQRAKWEEAGMKLPAPLAAYHIGKPSLCTFWNHAKGIGCKREKDGKKCDRDHKCMWCASTTHGAYMRVSPGTGTGVYQCPFYEGIRVELHSLGIDASIADLDAFVEELRTKGIPNDSSPLSQPPIQPPMTTLTRLPPKSNPSVPPSAALNASKDHHVPVGGVLITRSKPKKTKKESISLSSPASNAVSNPLSSHPNHPSQSYPASAPQHHPSPISKPGAPPSPTSAPLHNHAHLEPINPVINPASFGLVPGSAASQLFNPNPPSSIFDTEEFDNDSQFSDHSYADSDPVALSTELLTDHSAAVLSGPPAAAPMQHASASSMHLIMHPIPYNGQMELMIHTALIRTPSSSLYLATHSNSWLAHPTEVVVKLSALSSDAAERQKQQEKLESEFRAYTMFSKLHHPNLLNVIGRESMIESGTEQYALVVMEKADFSLSSFFGDMLPHLPIFQQHAIFRQQLTMGQPSAAPAITPLYRALCNQLINTYLLLHLHDRYHQRSIDPSNIYVSNAALSGFSCLSIDKETPTLKISDFSFHKSSPATPDIKLRGFLSPEASRANVPFGMLHHSMNLFDGKASDLFSIGCCLYYICSGGNMLFASDAERDDTQRRTIYLKRHFVDKSDPMLLDLINRLTFPSPGDRPPLDVIRHHPALWSPHLIIDFIVNISHEIERPLSNISGLISDIIGSNEFFSHSFPKTASWKDYVLPNWIASWSEWASKEPSLFTPPAASASSVHHAGNNGSVPSSSELDFRSIRTLLRCIAIMSDHLPGGLAPRTDLGSIVTRRLHYLVIALWSHLQQIGTFDEHHRFSFIS